MKEPKQNWFSHLFGGQNDPVEPPAATPDMTRPAEPSPPQQSSPEPGQTIAAPPVNDAPAFQVGAADVPAEWSEGDVILDNCEVKQIHESGGMGLVYRVHHQGWKQDLAVKSPRAEFFKTQAHRKSFVDECLTWMGLGLHPHIVCCYYVRVLGDIPRVFAEYVEGGSLKDWIEDKRLYAGGKAEALERMLDVAIQFARGLQYAHERSLIHRDVKPANVMMTPEGLAKVSDFGLAKARAAVGEVVVPGGRELNVLATLGGMTPAYCSPEQADIAAKHKAGVTPEQLPKLTRRTDLWSWGVSVLEMFTGEVTWPSGQAAAEVLESFLESGIQAQDIPKMPEAVAKLLRQCFQHNPEDRPKDMQAVVEQLKRVYRESIGRTYARAEGEAVEARADVLNNQGISYKDLGLDTEAEQLFEAALNADPHHLEATYNRGLILWRSGKLTDESLLKQLEAAGKSHADDGKWKYMAGLVHIERGDAESAVEVLTEALKGFQKSTEVERALSKARSGLGEWGRCLRSFEGHSGAVKSVAISPDGRWALIGKGKGNWEGLMCRNKLQLWDLASGQCLRSFEGHSESVNSVAVSADGRRGLSGSTDSTLRLWDLANGQCLHKFEGHGAGVMSAAISPNGRWGLSGSGDMTLRLWDFVSGQCLSVFRGHSGLVRSVAISPDGRWGLSGCTDKTLRLWDLASGRCLRTFKGHSDAVNSLAISRDGSRALSGSGDKTLRLWDLASGQCVLTLAGHSDIATAVAITPDGRWGLSGSADKMLRLWDLASGRCLRTFDGHSETVTSLAVSRDGSRALSGSDDNTVRLWSLAKPGPVGNLLPVRPERPQDLMTRRSEFNRAVEQAQENLANMDVGAALTCLAHARGLPGFERSEIASAALGRAAAHCKILALQACWCVRSFEGHVGGPAGGRFGGVFSVAISPDGQWGLSASDDKTLRLWNLASGQCVRTLEGHSRDVVSVVFSPDGRYALSGSGDSLKLWDVADGSCLRTFEGHSNGVSAVAISPDGRWGLSGSADEALRLWDLASGQCLRTLEGQSGQVVVSVAFSPDGRYALSGSRSSILCWWDLASGQCLRAIRGQLDIMTQVNSLAISPDGRRELFGCGGAGWGMAKYLTKMGVSKAEKLLDRKAPLLLFALFSGQDRRAFEGHLGDVLSVAVSPDGRWGLSGSKDKTLRLWDLASGQCLQSLEGHSREVLSVALSPDGRHALSGSRDNTLRLWQLDWEYEFPGWADWDEGAHSYLEIFLTLQCPIGSDGFARTGKPTWNEADFQRLIKDLQHRGFGWLRPEGVRKQLEKMAAEWQEPPPLLAEPSGTGQPPAGVAKATSTARGTVAIAEKVPPPSPPEPAPPPQATVAATHPEGSCMPKLEASHEQDSPDVLDSIMDSAVRDLNAGIAEMRKGDYAKAEKLIKASVPILEMRDDKVVLGRGYHHLALTYHFAGRPAEGIVPMEKAVRIRHEAKDPAVLQSLCCLTALCHNSGNLDRAISSAREAIELARGRDDRPSLALGLAGLARAFVKTGMQNELCEACKAFEEAIQIVAASKIPIAQLTLQQLKLELAMATARMPEGVRKNLQAVTRDGHVPPRLPGESGSGGGGSACAENGREPPREVLRQNSEMEAPPKPPETALQQRAADRVPMNSQETVASASEFRPPNAEPPTELACSGCADAPADAASSERDQEEPARTMLAEVSKPICPSCGKPAAQAQFCVHCGQALAKPLPQHPASTAPQAEGKDCTCGQSNPPGNRFCSRCGRRLPGVGPTTCPKCHATARTGVAFCTRCGAKMEP